MKTIITSVGYPGAGKSELADFLEDHGVNKVSMGNILRDRFELASEHGLVQEQIENHDNKSKSALLGDWATKQREIHGNDVVAQWTTEHVEKNIESEVVFVDGLRSPDELSVFRNNFNAVKVLYVDASISTRLERLQDRDRDGEGRFSKEDLKERDSREEDWGLSNIKEYADYTIENESSLVEFHNNIQSILDDIV